MTTLTSATRTPVAGEVKPPRSHDAPPLDEVLDELGAVAVGAGILTFVLFPFALPMIALTLAALIPLLVVGLAAGLVAAVAAAPVVLARRIRRGR